MVHQEGISHPTHASRMERKMSARQSSAVDRALALIGKRRADRKRHTAYSAAKAERISLSTIYRALERQRTKNGKR